MHTVEPLNNGHSGTIVLIVRYREVEVSVIREGSTEQQTEQRIIIYIRSPQETHLAVLKSL